MAKPKTNTKGESAQERPAAEPGKAGAEQPVPAPATNAAPAPEPGTGDAPKDASPVKAADKPDPKAGDKAADKTGDLLVVVTGPKKGRWRAGRHFGAEPVSIPLADLSEDDKQALISDLALSVTTVPAEPE